MFTYLKQSTTDKLDWRYAYKSPNHQNVFQIGRVVAMSRADAERKTFNHVFMMSGGSGVAFIEDAKRLGDNLNG